MSNIARSIACDQQWGQILRTDGLQLTIPEKSITRAQVSTITGQGITKIKQRGILDYNFRCTFQKMMLY
jgi:hypothetical protein